MQEATKQKYEEYLKEKSMISKSTLYWICQLGGWSLWGTYLFYLQEEQTLNNGLDTLFTISCMLLLSHYYKIVIVKRGWLKLLFQKLLLRTVFSSFVLAFINIPLTLILSMLIFNPSQWKEALNPDLLFQHFIVGTFLFFCWSVVYFLYHYVSSYNKNLRWEALINEFELNQLKSQLNPHFIFNALNTVRALIDENPDKAKSSVNQLSNILRNALMMQKKKVIPFNEELRIVKDYLALECTRYEERLQVNYQIDEIISAYQVPPMMLQTIVENGIKHGISKRKEGGFITLSAKVADEKLHLKIENTGKYNPPKVRKEGGYGLKSSIQRLELLYNGEASFRIFNHQKDAVITEIIIPKWDESEAVAVV